MLGHVGINVPDLEAARSHDGGPVGFDGLERVVREGQEVEGASVPVAHGVVPSYGERPHGEAP